MGYHFILLASIVLSVTNISQAQQGTDIIIINGKISTLDENNTVTEAVAIAGSKILATGSNRQMLKLKTKQTKIIDAKGNRVVPGLFDSHLHVIRGGRFYNSELRWDGVSTLKRAHFL